MKKTIAVLAASGYAGGELLRYLALHPGAEVVWVTAHRNAGRPIAELYPHLSLDLTLQATDAATVPDVDLAFLALPHGQAAETGKALADRGIKVVDLAADWRLHDAAAYDEWYGWTHTHPDELSGWIFGLTELHRDDIAGAARVANPGCYSTAAILPLAPLVREGLVETSGIVIDAASGVSGAGRNVDEDYLFTELDASFKAYGVGKHRHTPEIEQELGVLVTFTAHLVPMVRGLLATCYARMTSSIDDIRDCLQTAYKGEAFVRVMPGQPTTKQASGSNNALIGIGCDARTNTAVITCAIDNLGKGAAGQAIQNANLMLGFDETTGLTVPAVFP